MSQTPDKFYTLRDVIEVNKSVKTYPQRVDLSFLENAKSPAKRHRSIPLTYIQRSSNPLSDSSFKREDFQPVFRTSIARSKTAQQY